MPVSSVVETGGIRSPAVRGPLLQIATMGAAFAASNLARGAIAFASSLVIARGLGRDAFGGWVFCSAWASTLTTLFDLGLGTLLTRDAAKRERICPMVASALAVRVGLFIPVAAVFYVLAPRLVVQFVPTDALRAAVPLALTGMAYGCFAAVFRARPDRLARILALETIGACVQCALSWALLRAGGSTAQLLWLATFVQMAQLGIAAAWLMRVRSESDTFEPLSWTDAVETARRAIPFAGVGFIGTAQRRMIPLAVGYISGPEEVALFAVAWRMGNAARAVSSAALAGGLPVFADRANQENARQARPVFHRALTWFAWLSAVALAVGGRPLLRVTYGNAFAGAVPVLICVAVGLVPSFVNAGRRIYLYAEGREAVVLHWTTVTLIVQVIACAVLIPWWGAAGAACALAIGDLVVLWPLSRA